MDGWDTEDPGDDYPGEFDDSEFSGEAARRHLRRRGGGRGRPMPTTRDQAARQRTERLAQMQRRTAVQQSSDTFGPMATAAAGAFAFSRTRPEFASAALTHALPIVQILTTSRGRAIGSAFRANPIASLAFPLAAVALGLLKNRIPGLAPPTVAPPVHKLETYDSGKSFFVSVTAKPAGATVFYSKAPAGTEPSAPDQKFTGSLKLAPGERVKLLAKIGDAKSEVEDIEAPTP